MEKNSKWSTISSTLDQQPQTPCHWILKSTRGWERHSQSCQNSPRVLENKHVTTQTKMSVYKVCVIGTLLYGSKSWTTYSLQERKLQVFHLRCLCRILGILWQDRVCNNKVLACADLPSMYTLLHQRRLRWLGHVHRMDDGHIPKDLLYGELATGKRSRGRPRLCYKFVCKRDLRVCNINTKSWETFAIDRTIWRQQVATSQQQTK
ncbi:uncharacterized protein LOC125026206 [Penaeus chinensis]|uniref:uncharacterized protein LOC125026206 n=1 Tax=Penaeus chinensis TaxID=139456 RepID=UPI001FB71DEA|nr:uncharacterized protein LOC125026206 [Penaeus chinensis]